MHELTITRNTDDSADFELPQGCLSCGGALAVRMSAGGAASCCLVCHWLARPTVELDGNSISVAYPPVAEA